MACCFYILCDNFIFLALIMQSNKSPYHKSKQTITYQIYDFFRDNIHLLISLMVAICVYFALSDVRFLRRFVPSISMETVYLLAWDSFLIAYLLLVLRMFVKTGLEDIKKQAHEQYERKRTMLVLILATSFISMIAIINEMRISAEFEGWLSTLHVCITFMTLIVSWLFIHTLFALYYAHGYYDDNPDDKYPLDFPYENNPDYWDFLYFALGIGATGGVSDVAFTSKKLRRIGTFHSVLSFFFNTAVLSLVMEMMGGLVSPN